MKRPAVLLGLAILLLLAALGLKGQLLSLPGADEASSADGFQTGRALARLGRILGDQRPHPVDTEANDAVRERLIAELRAIGLEPRQTDDFTCNGSADDRTISCARIRNVVATIGPAEGRHLLLVSHYDSTPVGPGASDDGIGVATMLEIAALMKGERVARPVTFLFNEGEETGLIGARAFLEHDPLPARVDALINLESRGVSGPAVMFETSLPNRAAIAAYERTAERPLANSLTTDFARLIPNRTDVSVFAERDWTILNFAVIGNETRYHSPGDTLAALDPQSVRHMGDQALSLARDLARGRPTGPAGTSIYADLMGRTLIAMPAALGFALLAILLLLFAWLCRQRRGGIGRAVATVAAAMTGSLALSFAAMAITGLLRSGAYWRAFPEVTGMAVYATSLAASVIAVLLVAGPLARDRLRAGYWLVFLILGGALSLVAPGAAIFFLLPPLVAVVGIAGERRWPGAERVAALTAWAILFLSWAPLLHLSEILLDMDAAWIFAPIAALILLPVLIELKPLLARLSRRAVIGALATLSVIGWIATAFPPAYSADRKQRFSIEYVWNEPERNGQWMIYHDGGPLPAAFTANARYEQGVEVPWSNYERWAAPAPAIRTAPPMLERLSERRVSAGRLASFRLRTNGAGVIRLRAEPEARLLAARIGGATRRFGQGDEDEEFTLRCHGRSCDGLRVDLLTAVAAPVELTLIGVSNGLPAAAAPMIAARPADAAPQYIADSSIAITKIRF